MGRIFETRKATMFARWDRMSKAFTRIGKDVAIAVKAGGPNPDGNPALRRSIQNARAVNMPKDRIEAAIKRASGQSAADYQEVLYEGYGPNGIAVLVETATDNPTRTVANVRGHFNKYGGNLGSSGSVGFLFKRMGVFRLKPDSIDQESLELDAAVAFFHARSHMPVLQIQTRRDRGGAQAFVFIVTANFRMHARRGRQIGAGCRQRLHARFFIDRDGHDPRRADRRRRLLQLGHFAIDDQDLLHLTLKLRIPSLQVVFDFVRTQGRVPQDRVDGRFDHVGHRWMTGGLGGAANVLGQSREGPQLGRLPMLLRLGAGQRQHPNFRLRGNRRRRAVGPVAQRDVHACRQRSIHMLVDDASTHLQRAAEGAEVLASVIARGTPF